jgi:hypothetical protein
MRHRNKIMPLSVPIIRNKGVENFNMKLFNS